jgi:hypothetical protein
MDSLKNKNIDFRDQENYENQTLSGQFNLDNLN